MKKSKILKKQVDRKVIKVLSCDKCGKRILIFCNDATVITYVRCNVCFLDWMDHCDERFPSVDDFIKYVKAVTP